MIIALLSSLYLQMATAKAHWQVPFYPVKQVALSQDNRVYFATADELYAYDVNGDLIARRDEKTRPLAAYCDQLQQLYIYDTKGVLRCFSPALEPVWDRSFSQPQGPAFAFRRWFAIADTHTLMLIDPQTGETVHALYIEAGIQSVQTLESMLLVSGNDGLNRFWDGRHRRWNEPDVARFATTGVRFMTRGPDRSVAAVLANRSLAVYRADWHKRWERNFVVDVALPPVWLGTAKKPILAVASQARDIRVYTKSGRESWRVNLRDRPTALVHLGGGILMTVHRELAELQWIDLNERRQESQKLSAHVTHVLQNQNTVLFIDYGGFVTTYDIQSALVAFNSE